MYASGLAANTLPKNAASSFGNSALVPQSIDSALEVSQMLTCLPVKFTWAMRHAETHSWQLSPHAPLSHSGATPTEPSNVTGLPFSSRLVTEWSAGSAHLT